jgi:hypothetical protein
MATTAMMARKFLVVFSQWVAMPKVLELVEAAFDQMPFFGHVLVERKFLRSRRVRGNDGQSADGLDVVAEVSPPALASDLIDRPAKPRINPRSREPMHDLKSRLRRSC